MSHAGETSQARQTGSWLHTTRRYWVEGLLILLFWGLYALLILLRQSFDTGPNPVRALFEGEVAHGFLEYIAWALVTPLVFWLSYRATLHRRRWLVIIPLYIGIGVVIAGVMDFVDHLLWNMLVPDAPRRSLSVFFILDSLHFLAEFFLYVALLIAGFARAYFVRFQEHENESNQLRMEAARLHGRLAEARLQTLRMQINPHFLFNTLHIISDNFEENPRVARRMIARLSDILRYTFEKTQANEVTLRQEMDFIDGYLDIQRFRFEENLHVTKDIAPDAWDALIPNLILQPLVENAIKHGVSQREGQGHITLRAWREDDQVHLEVEDNGPGLSVAVDDLPAGIGLSNTRQRLAGRYGDKQEVVLTSVPTGGLRVGLSLPYHTEADYQVVAMAEV